jgi:hypothetical protein
MEQDQQESDLKLEAAQKMHLDYGKFTFEQLKEKAQREIEQPKELSLRNAASAKTQAAAAARRAATGEKTAGDQSRNIDSEITTRAGQLGVSRGQLGVSQRNAGTAAAAQQDMAAYHKGTLDIKRADGKKVSPSQQNYALDVAYRQLSSDPEFAAFVKKDDKGFYDVEPGKVDEKSLTYQSFRRRVKALAEAAIKKGTPYDDLPDDVDSDLVTIGKPRVK